MQVESIPLTQLQNQVSGVQTEISAYGQLSSALSTFQQSLTQLTLPTEFQTFSATSSNTSVLSASAVVGAQPGTYTVDATQLAQAQSLATAGQASLNTHLSGGSGNTTVTFAFGTQSGTTQSGMTFTPNLSQSGGSITINSSNDTLSGLRDAINNANLGVTASIVNDGSNTPYHLVLTSNQTGANESMQISVQGDASISSLLTYPPGTGDTMTQTVAAQNANLTVNGLALSSSTNTVATALPGLALNLQQTGTSTVTVANNTSGVQTNIDNFVSAYNTLQSTISSLTAYNSGGTNGPLIGDATTMQIENQLQGVIASQLQGTGGGYASLSAVGIAVNNDGTLSVDDSTLSQALQSNPNQFAALFGTAGSATNSNVTYLIGGTNTKPGSYAVNITQAATQGTFTGSSAPSTNPTTIPSGGLPLTVTVDGVMTNVTLGAGTYTPSQLATALQTTINTDATLQQAGVSVNVTQNSGVLNVASTSYGSQSSVSITGTGAAQLFGSASTSIAGLDVQGTIGGYVATGSGQVLTVGNSGPAAGMEIQVTGTSTGALGNVNYSQGYASLLNGVVTNATDATSGSITNATNTLNTQVTSLQTQETSLQSYIAQVQQQYQTQFGALDAMVVQMQSTASYLQQVFNPTTSSGS
ncbi:flagellar filament capping protein FliD [Paraburkholderia sp. RL17-337-BIB-A]|uniref:flagellar filament capping protein FliD n=1 Tax=Paraburkholderia sp. RL17-337-BIB-A TaxID=3031636 RepID=UPI0038BCEDEA